MYHIFDHHPEDPGVSTRVSVSDQRSGCFAFDLPARVSYLAVSLVIWAYMQQASI